MSDDPITRILSAIERLRIDVLKRLDRLESTSGDRADPGRAEIVAHVQNVGDVHGGIGDWIGERGSRRSIEGFRIAPRREIGPDEFFYQAVLGRDWLSPWMPRDKFCGSRGLALPLRGFCLRLQGTAAAKYDCRYSATFVDGSVAGSISQGQVCAAATLAPLEAFEIVLRTRAS
jgi:hypothetical protein